jgi:hypothetical protein
MGQRTKNVIQGLVHGKIPVQFMSAPSVRLMDKDCIAIIQAIFLSVNQAPVKGLLPYHGFKSLLPQSVQVTQSFITIQIFT